MRLEATNCAGVLNARILKYLGGFYAALIRKTWKNFWEHSWHFLHLSDWSLAFNA